MSSVIKAARVVHVSRGEGGGPAGAGDVVAAETTLPEMSSMAAELLAAWMLNGAPLVEGAAVKARRVVEAARREAEEIAAEAEARRDEFVEEARRTGFEEGLEAGRQQGREEGLGQLEGRLAQAVELLEEARQAREKLVEQHRDDIVRLAVALAAKLTRKARGLDEETARRLLEDMLPRVDGARRAVVKLNPDDLAALRDELGSLAAKAGQDTAVEFAPDARLRPGEVVVETDQGGLDGTAFVRARRLAEQLLDGIGHGD